ncbi:P-loop containing nucleoside triphosphate hydrolase protein [Tilletiopsis washingtonensis]|uniref:P-loop containing nucleoside triphosphate hydrolase protein n=1 Tax=Tilletiopsis washingtonensis TaxID=58919 RepID=A0A316Z5F1_9BASI|nr:P-loop containing nucleoside triphosphate hydrolase protein [Tilletiopsis washingtonensis]PWN96536.1 P-loop containing nucleoside triphosphate hydrolase protein [Tilletiopsis washingtonensis]
MFSPPLSALALPSRLAHLHSSPLLASDILLRPVSELSAALRLAERDVLLLQHAAAEALAGPAACVAEGHDEEHESAGALLQTGDARIDALLGGGVQRGSLTELVGESSSGKTQLLLQLAVHTALGLASASLSSASSTPSSSSAAGRAARWHAPQGVAYLSTSGLASASALVRRLVEISDHSVLASLRPSSSAASSGAGAGRAKQARPSVYEAEEVELARERMLANVHLACVGDGEALEHALLYTLPALIHRCSSDAKDAAAAQQREEGGGGAAEIGLIIIDDLPALFQEDNNSGSMSSLVARSRMLFELADRLKVLAHCGGREDASTVSSTSAEHTATTPKRRPIAVVVVNHVSDVFERERALAISSGRELLSLSSSAPASRSIADLPRTLRTAREAGLDAPLAFVQQAATFSGLYATNDALLEALRRGEDARGIDAATSRLKQAALGLPWVNGINTRLLLSKSPRKTAGGAGEEGEAGRKEQQVSRATLLFSPFASAQKSVRFVIGPGGVRSLEEDAI